MSPLPECVRERLTELGTLCARWGVRRLGLFGSGARGGVDVESSDLDFLVEFAPMPPPRRADSYFGLLADLESLFGRPIDLIEPDAIRNDIFRRAVIGSQVIVHDAA